MKVTWLTLNIYHSEIEGTYKYGENVQCGKILNPIHFKLVKIEVWYIGITHLLQSVSFLMLLFQMGQ